MCFKSHVTGCRPTCMLEQNHITRLVDGKNPSYQLSSRVSFFTPHTQLFSLLYQHQGSILHVGDHDGCTQDRSQMELSYGWPGLWEMG
jgi:hypothetical protein